MEQPKVEKFGEYAVIGYCCACNKVYTIPIWRGDRIDWARFLCTPCVEKGFAIYDDNLYSNDNDFHAWELIETSGELLSEFRAYRERQAFERAEARKKRKNG